VLATSPDASARNGAEAVQFAERAARLSGGNDPAVLDVLAAAYAEARRFPEAAKTARRVLPSLALPNGSRRVALRQRLRRPPQALAGQPEALPRHVVPVDGHRQLGLELKRGHGFEIEPQRFLDRVRRFLELLRHEQLSLRRLLDFDHPVAPHLAPLPGSAARPAHQRLAGGSVSHTLVVAWP
jgi:hypothetical protein